VISKNPQLQNGLPCPELDDCNMKGNPQTPPDELDRWLDGQLKQLPDRPAPASLMPRVLEALRTQAHLPWYRQAWTYWPRLAQASSLLVLSFLLGALTYAALHFPELAAADDLGARLQTWLAPLAALWSVVQALGSVAAALCHKAGGWLCLGLGIASVTAYLSAVGAGTVLVRLARSNPEQKS
jgi:succinate dehydrogenase/fumarate reductase cytochrome b subunit